MPERRLQKTRDAYPPCERCGRIHLGMWHADEPKIIRQAAKNLADEIDRRVVASTYNLEARS